ncbi:acyltransferase [Shewanella putrefaciens]|uniref:acyltransferase n=1 Tax=Shewanella putrefaciens TaxID=24 RepID=UPI001C692759|nr:DapH/DapD/GlmU-related protein [Shewanella putrefaciens]
MELHGEFELIHPENFSYGDNLSINGGVYINAGSDIVLGKNVSLSAKCMLITKGLNPKNLSEHYSKPIRIGSNMQVGAGAIVLPGVSIVSNVIIAAGSVVTKNIEISGVYAGVPCKKLVIEGIL